MIPTYFRFINRHNVFFAIGCFISVAILMTSLVRNTLYATPQEMFTGLTAIAVSFAWTMAREGRAYWMYTICTMRMYENKQTIEQLAKKTIGDITIWLAKPLCSAGISIATSIVLYGISMLLPDYLITGWLLFCGVIILPYGIFVLHKKTLHAYIQKVILHISKRTLLKIKRRRITHYLVEDIVIVLMVNLALVLPLSSKPDFSVTAGIDSPAFIIAMIILMEIVTGFMLLVAQRSRRYIFCGEIISEALVNLTSKKYLKTAIKSRIIFWMSITLAWTCSACLILSSFSNAQFWAVYLCCLLIPLMIFSIEKYNVLKRDYHQAKKILHDLSQFKPADVDN
ncbi:hypothetical protein [Erwinia oleae]|uniref:hypothetical protein n=1 Tax=Erwinia oleae TaxID=796334 RepID=UPI000558DEA7|nr:hypothetical protein [Erwinia oleae]